MRTPCSRSDGELTKQALELSRRLAAPHQSPTSAIYYNRLEYCRMFRLRYAAVLQFLRLLPTVAFAHRLVGTGAPSRFSAGHASLSPPQVRESCQELVLGVTPIRRGIA
jgi:hypothetical protein